jgi:YidC/Oxa1 family membrane protein insertase
MSEVLRLILAVALSMAVLLGWQWYIAPDPRDAAVVVGTATDGAGTTEVVAPPVVESCHAEPRAVALQNSGERLFFESADIKGSVRLKGLQFDDVTLLHYKESLEEDSANVDLLSPESSTSAFFANFGWTSSDPEARLPGANTVWQTDATSLKSGETVNLYWDSCQGLRFNTQLTLDGYIFTVTQSVTKVEEGVNYPQHLTHTARVVKLDQLEGDQSYITSSGAVGVVKDGLFEYDYGKIKKKGLIAIDNFSLRRSAAKMNRWVGFTDKYWLTALVPMGNSAMTLALRRTAGDSSEIVATTAAIDPGAPLQYQLFAGAKELKTLEDCGRKFHIFAFDRAVDFGKLYFLSKPILILLLWFKDLTHNFGIAIMLLTVVVRLLMFPLVSKSQRSMDKVKKLQPEIAEIKKRYGDDKQSVHRETMALFQKHGLNPMSGCLPLLLQIPVFFALYKVLYVSIDMRHAPFFGWITDLSAPDPVNLIALIDIFDLGFGHFAYLGVWPLIFGITMMVQQKIQGSVMTDQTQASVMKLLPFLLMFMFGRFPAGLIIYWSWSNVLSIVQSVLMSRLSRAK